MFFKHIKAQPIFNSSNTVLAKISILFLLSFFISACISNSPAPVINRQPANATIKTPPQKANAAKRQAYQAGDWRPNTYVVKTGDTLFSIGLAFGYDYKEIASANRINPPYVIRVGQALQLASLKKAEAANTSDGNVTTFALSDQAEASVTSKTVPPNNLANVEPKVAREPQTDTANTNAMDAKNMTWAWPTKGKVMSGFNQAGNKGIDIAGTRGQAIQSAGAGKVIYSGSDLRGYGNLVIVKHNAMYLSVYAHNSVILVKEGQQVVQGQKIAEMGDTDSPVVKLHFEIRKQGQSVDPMLFLAEQSI